MVKKENKQKAGAPAWMVTYGDMMTLLLCFFVILVAMSEVKKDRKYEDVVRSIQEAFGFVGGLGRVPTHMVPRTSMLDKLQEAAKPHEPSNIGDSQQQGIQGKSFRISQVREGVEVAYGGPITFERFRAELSPTGAEQAAKIAELVRGHNTKIEVRGHATSEPLPADSPYRDAYDLAYERARSVAEGLIGQGIRASRIRIVAAGDTERLKGQAYSEDRRAANRRVEVLVRESLVTEFAGEEADFQEQ
ncbi:MAG: OmpA family protein [Phycisphaerales bacterium]|nr:MAG: OmpA family protein [Phycisphaerales bacterium]